MQIDEKIQKIGEAKNIVSCEGDWELCFDIRRNGAMGIKKIRLFIASSIQEFELDRNEIAEE